MTVSIQHPLLQQLQIQLIAPNGLGTVTLLRNQINNSGNSTGGGVGIASGVNMGWVVNPSGVPNSAAAVGTVFDSQAVRRDSEFEASVTEMRMLGSGHGTGSAQLRDLLLR